MSEHASERDFNTDGIERNTDELESLAEALVENTDTLEANTDGLESGLSAVASNTDALEANTDQIESLLSALGGNTDTVEALLSAIGGNTDTLETLLGDINNKTPDLRTDFMAGRIRTAGGKVSLSAGQTGAFQLSNPAGSGKVFTVANFYLACDMNVDVSFSFDSVLGGTPVVLSPFNPNRASSGAASAVTRSTTGGASGGTLLSPVYRIPANIPMMQDFPVVLLPGQSVETRIAIGALSNAAFYVSATWAEDPA